MNRWIGFLKIRPGEERVSALLVGLMLVTAAGGAVGGSATEALFFARFGVSLLPLMYILLGLFALGASLAITGLMGRIDVARLYTMLPLLLGFFLAGERLIILINAPWIFAAIWIMMNIINSLLGLLTWGLAGTSCDTRQAKRLFPLFSAGAILGTVIGGLVTPLLAAWLHAENLILIWAGTLFVTFALGRALARSSVYVQPVSHLPQHGIVEEMQRGFQFVRGSPILQWISYSAILFSVCFYALALPFSRGAAAQYPNADALAGFLGLFQSLYTGAALLASLFLANRLFSRFGILPMLLLFPIIYLAGFGVMTAISGMAAVPILAFRVLVAFRFAQMAYMLGIAGTAWQAIFNVVPSEQREQVRAFVNGVPEQAGTFIAGLVLLVGDKTLQPEQLYLVGLITATLTVYLIWRASRAYSQALIDALHAGQPHVFTDQEQLPPGLIPITARHDPAPLDSWAVSAAVRTLDDPDPGMRLVSVEIMSQIPVPEAAPALIHALSDEDAQVKVAALKGLACARATPALLEVAACLSDPDAEVRSQAVDTLRHLAPYPRGIHHQVAPLLADPSAAVRVKAALSLVQDGGSHAREREILQAMARDADAAVRALALDALGECWDETVTDLAVFALDDPQPGVRQAAIRALAAAKPHIPLEPLIRQLRDEDRSVRLVLAAAFGQAGERALEPLVDALNDPSCAEGALVALEYLPIHRVEQRIRIFITTSSQAALNYYDMAIGMAQQFPDLTAGEGQLQLLFDSLENQARRKGSDALRALGLLIPRKRAAIAAAVENLQSPSTDQRANALEILESTGEQQTISPLIALWEGREQPDAQLPGSWLEDLLADPDPWLRACAILATPLLPAAGLYEKIREMSGSDPDEIVRLTAGRLTTGEMPMETLPTLSIMERILFLRRVPLFSGLQPTELKPVAAIASEVLFTDGQALALSGEPGSEMFIIITGEVRVLMTAAGQKELREFTRRRSGDYVGEMAVISQEPRMATLIADGPVRVLCIKQKQFESMLRERPEISLAMMRTLSQRLKEATQAAIGAGALTGDR